MVCVRAGCLFLALSPSELYIVIITLLCGILWKAEEKDVQYVYIYISIYLSLCILIPMNISDEGDSFSPDLCSSNE
jgi:hypothetical protein